VQVQPDDIADLGVQLGVGTELEGLHPPRLQVPFAPDPGHRREPDLQLGGQQSRRPVRHAEMRRWSAVIGNGGHHNVNLVDLGRSATARHIPQGTDPASFISIAPADHRRAARPGPARDLGVGQTLRG